MLQRDHGLGNRRDLGLEGIERRPVGYGIDQREFLQAGVFRQPTIGARDVPSVRAEGPDGLADHFGQGISV